MTVEIVRENNLLIAKGARSPQELEKAVQEFVAVEIAESQPCLTPDDIENAKQSGKQLIWHPKYNRLAWPDMDPPLDIVEVWRSKMLGDNALIRYRCQNPDCVRCHNSLEGLSAHIKLIRADGFDAFGAVIEVEIKKGKGKTTELIHVEQPVFLSVCNCQSCNGYLKDLEQQRERWFRTNYVQE